MTIDITDAIIDVEYDGSERSVRQLGAMTGLPPWAIRRSREPQKKKRGRRQRWTRWQDDLLKAYLGMLSEDQLEDLASRLVNPSVLDNLTSLRASEIALLVGHSVNALKIRAFRQGWRTRMRNPDWMTARHVSGLMGVDGHNVTKWIERGYLKAGTMPFEGRIVYRILQEDLEAFILDPENWAYYDAHKIIDPALSDLTFAVRDGDEYLTTGQVARRLGCTSSWLATLIRRGDISAKRWGNHRIHRNDIAKIKLPGRGRADSIHHRRFTIEEDLQLLADHAVGLGHRMISLALNRHTSSSAYRWTRLTETELTALIERHPASILMIDGRILGSWRELLQYEVDSILAIIPKAIDKFLLGEEMATIEMTALQGLFATWLEFFVDGRHLKRERGWVRYKLLRDIEKIRAVHLALLRIGLDPCHDRWAPGWQRAIDEGHRLRVKEAIDPGGDG